ncbi:unnamed protein product [Diamesa tonsa]
MTYYHDEVEIEDFEYDEDDEIYTYPCPCGDSFVITKEELMNGEEEATCPSCSLVVKVIYSKDMFSLKTLEEELTKISETTEKVACN